MSAKNKILITILILLGLISSFIQNQNLEDLMIVVMPIVIITMKLTDYFMRKKLIKQINNKNMIYIKVKENNKGMILVAVLLIFNMSISLKSTLKIYPIQNHNSVLDIISYINSFDYSSKMILFACIMLFIIAISMVLQVLFGSSIITDDKVIFYDDLVFDFNKIEEIEYKDSIISKSKKIIKLGKGAIDRSLIVKEEDFEKVKSLLESKTTLWLYAEFIGKLRLMYVRFCLFID